MKIVFSKDCLRYSSPGHPESPLRLSASYEYLEKQKFQFIRLRQKTMDVSPWLNGEKDPVKPKAGQGRALWQSRVKASAPACRQGRDSAEESKDTTGVGPWSFIEPELCKDEDILLVHSESLLKQIKKGNFFDADTPNLENIFYYASLAAGAAVKAALLSIEGENTFSLMRPPGHHATRNNLGGFCYFNNIAIAVEKAKEKLEKIAVVDLDCHHGNGTQDIFLGRKDIIYVSLHQSPLYPGTGLKSTGNCFNYPLVANTSPEVYLEVLKKALDNVINFKPDLIAVSMGFDTYKFDPLAGFSLEKDSYFEIGKLLKEIGKPIFSVLEGGYNTDDLPKCIENFLKGIA